MAYSQAEFEKEKRELEKLERDCQEFRGGGEAQDISLAWESTTADHLLAEQRQADRRRINRYSKIHPALNEAETVEPRETRTTEGVSDPGGMTKLMEFLAEMDRKQEQAQKHLREDLREQVETFRCDVRQTIDKEIAAVERRSDKKIIEALRGATESQAIADAQFQKQIAAHTLNAEAFERQMEETIMALRLQKQKTEENTKRISVLEEQAAEVVTTNYIKRIEKLERQATSNANNSVLGITSVWGGGNVTRLQAASQPPPRFSADGRERPMRFLKNFQEYCQAVGLEGTDIRYVLKDALKGEAANWWDLEEREDHDIESFSAAFRGRYWTVEIQDKIRSNLEFGVYDQEGQRRTRAEYATLIIGNARDLTDKMTDEEIIRRLSRHFDEEVRCAVRVRQIRRTCDFLELLESIDMAGPLNARRHPARSHDYQRSTPRYEGLGMCTSTSMFECSYARLDTSKLELKDKRSTRSKTGFVRALEALETLERSQRSSSLYARAI